MFATPLIRITCWKNLGVNWDPLSHRSHCGWPCTRIKLSTNVCSNIFAELLKIYIAFTSLENRSIITSRNQISHFAVRSRHSISMGTIFSGAVTENGCIPLLFRRRLILFFSKWCSFIQLRRNHVCPEDNLAWKFESNIVLMDVFSYWLDDASALRMRGGTDARWLVPIRRQSGTWDYLCLAQAKPSLLPTRTSLDCAELAATLRCE